MSVNVKVVKRINATTNVEITFEGERDLKEAILKITPFMQLSQKCGICGSEDVALQCRPTKEEFLYLEQYCRACRARRNFGSYKQPQGAMFLKDWEKYEPKAQVQGQIAQQPQQSSGYSRPEPSKAERIEKMRDDSRTPDDQLPF